MGGRIYHNHKFEDYRLHFLFQIDVHESQVTSVSHTQSNYDESVLRDNT